MCIIDKVEKYGKSKMHITVTNIIIIGSCVDTLHFLIHFIHLKISLYVGK